MNKIVITLGLIIAPLSWSNTSATNAAEGKDPKGVISYCLPSTSINIEVHGTQEIFFAGPYAKYANKYLGINVETEDRTSYTITEVKMKPYIEADITKRYLIDTEDKNADLTFLKMTNCGLIATANGSLPKGEAWRFPINKEEDFSKMGITSNLTFESTTLYSRDRKSNSQNKVSIQQDMMVTKSLETKAAETAEIIFSLRKKRLEIITGDTDATYSGEAMGAAIEEIARLEKEYLTLFTGYTETSSEHKNFEVIPNAAQSSQLYIAFRLSDTEGLLPADNLSGKPIVMEIIPDPIPESKPLSTKKKKESKAIVAYYKIPAICTIKLINGMNTLIQGRIPVYQFGKECNLPIKVTTK